MQEIDKVIIKEGFPEKNYPKMLKWFQDLDVVKYLIDGEEISKYKTVKDIERFFDKNKNTKYFKIKFNDEGIGYTCLYDQINNSQCSIGIIIGERKYWGKGLGKKAMIQTMDYAFDKLNVEIIHLTVCDLHKKAQKLYKKIGFKTTKHIKNDRKIFLDDKWIAAGTYHMEFIKDLSNKI